MRAPLLAALSAGVVAGCAGPDLSIATYQPAPGVNQVLRGAIDAAPRTDLIMGDLMVEPGGEIPPHYHHGEEFIYVIGGSTTISRPGEPDLVLHAGEGMRMPPGVVHWGYAGPEGARVITAWVKPHDQPLRIPVER